MAKCKDCLHYEACLNFSKIINAARNVEKGCEHFKDRTKYKEVVRCKDCKHYLSYGRTSLLVDGENIKCGWCKRRIRHDEEYRMLPDDFCSYGERREDNAAD